MTYFGYHRVEGADAVSFSGGVFLLDLIVALNDLFQIAAILCIVLHLTVGSHGNIISSMQASVLSLTDRSAPGGEPPRAGGLGHLSLQTFTALSMCVVMRFCSYFLVDQDSASCKVFFLHEGAKLGLALCVFHRVQQKLSTYSVQADNFGHWIKALPVSPTQLRVAQWSVLYLLGCSLAFFVWVLRRGGHSGALGSYVVCFAEVLSAIALWPQILMFHNNKVVDRLLGDVILCCVASKLVSLLFWVLYPSLILSALAGSATAGGRGRPAELVGAEAESLLYPSNRGVQIAADLLNLLLLSDFLVLMVKERYQQRHVSLDKQGTVLKNDLV